MMRVNVQKLIDVCEKEGVTTLLEFADYIKGQGVQVSQRTLYNWQNGGGFQSKKLDLVADKLAIKNPIELIEISERS